MSIEDHTEGYLEEVRKFAASIGMRDQLEGRLKYLEEYGPGSVTCRLYKDWAPYSFSFVLVNEYGDSSDIWFNGGLIFHGSHDRGGDGGAPTFSVNLTPTKGWAVHT